MPSALARPTARRGDTSPLSAIDARDAALLLLGWAAALRRSELIGLDWLQLGTGTGFVQIEERGVVVTLPTSKGSQEAAVTIVVPCQDMRSACDALERWPATANLAKGEPVFRSVNKEGAIGGGSTDRAQRQSDRQGARL